jgi:malate synthase
MAAYIPSRRDPEVNEVALRKVTEDKEREARDGFDGTWVAHPDLVPVAAAVFDRSLGARPHQKDRLRDDVRADAGALAGVGVPGGTVSPAGVRGNVEVALRYLEAWLRGSGAVGIHNLMEDTATAEISRAQLWQWIRHGTAMDDGRPVTRELFAELRRAELDSLEREAAEDGGGARWREAAELLDALVLGAGFTEFLTIPGYAYLD